MRLTRLQTGGAVAAAVLAGLAHAERAPAAFPGANGKIAFVSDRSGRPEIYVMNGDGSGQRRLTNDRAGVGGPAWSPDGRRIAYMSGRGGNADIWVMNADGSGARRLTTDPANDWGPAWSPDGKRIAFVSGRRGPKPSSTDIFVMDADGGEQMPCAASPGQEKDPAWAPDGRSIVYNWQTSFTDNELLTVGAACGHTALLPPSMQPAEREAPNWSPDGRRIAFEGYVPGTEHESYVMNADGSGGVTRLTAPPGNNQFPVFSPDGRRIAFASDRDGNAEIYVMNADGSGATRLTNNPAADSEPDWQPLPLELLVADVTAVGEAALLRVDPVTGAHETIASGDGSLLGTSLALEKTGSVAVLSQSPVRLALIDPLTGAKATISVGGSFVDPHGVAVEADGSLLVVEGHAFGGSCPGGCGGVIRVDPRTGAQTKVSSRGNFENPWGIAVAASGDIYVSDLAGRGAVIRVDPRTGAQRLVSAGGSLRDPVSIAVAPGGELLVADSGGLASQGGKPGRVIRIDPTSGTQTLVAAGGSLVDPSGIALAPDGAIFVTDVDGLDYRSRPRIIRIDPRSGAQETILSGRPLRVPIALAFAPAVGPSVRVTTGGHGRVTSAPGGIDCGARCVMRAPTGATVTLSAHPAAGSVFAGWSGACTGRGRTCRLTVERAVSVGARFVRPGVTIESAAFAVHWRESVASGSLIVRGRANEPSQVALTLRRGGLSRTVASARLTLRPPSFRVALPLPRDIRPGRYVVRLEGTSLGIGLAVRRRQVSLPAPPEGVVASAQASAVRGGPPATRLPGLRREIWARFEFAALPRLSPLTVTWYGPAGQPVAPPVGKPARAVIDTFVRSEDGLPRGAWRCVLRADGAAVATARVWVG